MEGEESAANVDMNDMSMARKRENDKKYNAIRRNLD